ncbi:MAG: rane protein [Candidatus Saccharibacteria bacterium]|nr:rane protein [Candidatus Saccharibacteria bacterium]
MLTQECARQVVVLGGGLTPDGQPSQETYERAVSAVYYTDRFDADSVIFGGGRGFLADGLADVRAEADVMEQIAVEHGMDPERIIGLDRSSRNTFETFLNIKPLLTEQKTAIITHAYHMPRALRMARLVLPQEVVGFEALAEHSGKARAPLNERVLQLATRLSMTGVSVGDDVTLRRRNEVLAKVIDTPSRIGLLKATLLRNHTSVEASKPASQK